MEYLGHGHGQEGHRRAVGAVGYLPYTGLNEVADEVGHHDEQRDEQSLIRDIEAHAAGEDAGLCVARAAAHDVRLCLLHAQRQRREAVGYKVYPQQMHRLKNGEAQYSCEEDAKHLAHVRAEQELDRLADVAVHAAAFLDSADYRCKVIVREHHVGGVLGDVGAGDAHADADVGGLDAGRVVDAVACHGGDVARLAPCVYDAGLVLRLDAGVDADIFELLLKLLVAHLVELRAGDGLAAVGENAELLCDGNRGVDMVAGYHDGADARLAALRDGVHDFGADGVYHAAQPHEAQLLLKGLRLEVDGLCIPDTLGTCEHSQRAVGHGLVRAEYLGAVLVGHRDAPAVGIDIIGALADKHVGRALGVLDAAAAVYMDGAHELARGVKRSLATAQETRLERGLIRAELIRPCDERGLGRLARDLAALIQLRVGTQRHGGSELLLVGAEVIDDGHLVLGEGAGLVGTDYLRAAESLDRSQLANYRVALGHVRDADGQHHRDDGDKPFGDGRDGEGDGDHERIEHDLDREAARAQQLYNEHQRAYAEHQPGQYLRQLGHLYLQRGLPLLGGGQSVGDLAHLGVHAGGGDDGGTAAVDHGAAHVDHVLAVAEGDVLRLIDKVYRVDELQHGDGFAGQRGFLYLEAGAGEQAAVGGDCVARFEQDDVAGDKLLAVDRDELTVAQNLRGGSGHLLQRLDGFLGLVLLIHAEHGVDDDDGEDDDNVGKALALHDREHAAYRRRGEQDDYHRVCHLAEEALDQGLLGRLLQLVFAVRFEPLLGFGAAQAVLGAVKLGKDGFLFFAIGFHRLSSHISFACGSRFICDLANKKRPLQREL